MCDARERRFIWVLTDGPALCYGRAMMNVGGATRKKAGFNSRVHVEKHRRVKGLLLEVLLQELIERIAFCPYIPVYPPIEVHLELSGDLARRIRFVIAVNQQ